MDSSPSDMETTDTKPTGWANLGNRALVSGGATLLLALERTDLNLFEVKNKLSSI